MTKPKGPSLPTADAPKSITKPEIPVRRNRDTSFVDITTSNLARLEESLNSRTDALATLAIRPKPTAPKIDPLFNHPMNWQLRQHEYLMSREKDRPQPTPETLPSNDQLDESSPPPTDDPDKTPRPAHATIKIENPSDGREKQEIRAREKLWDEQRRLHEDTLAGLLEVSYWWLRAEHAATRLEKTMTEMRRFIEDIRAGRE